MGAIANRFAVEDAAVLAIGGGADLVIVAGRNASDFDVADRIVRAVTAAVVSAGNPRRADRAILCADHGGPHASSGRRHLPIPTLAPRRRAGSPTGKRWRVLPAD